MAVSFRSYSADSNTGTFNRNVVLSKPTGLAVGDLMVAFIFDNFLSKSTPGFTQLPTSINAGLNGTIWKKIATQTDVDATNFTFTFNGDGAGRSCGVFLVVCYGQSSQEIASYSIDPSSTSGTNVTVSNAIVPYSNSLILMGIVSTSSNTVSTSNQAISTNNPTWTEISELNWSLSSYYNICVAYATRPENTSTGNTSYTVSPSSTTNAALVAIPLSQDFTISETTSTSEVKTLDIQTTLTDTVTSTETLNLSDISREWVKESKPTTTWTNEPKN